MPSTVSFFFNGTATTEIYTLSLHTLFRSLSAARSLRATNSIPFAKPSRRPGKRESWLSSRQEIQDAITRRDRKSTRLNSSHLGISYAVFCLKKKRSNDRQNPGPHNIHRHR